VTEPSLGTATAEIAGERLARSGRAIAFDAAKQILLQLPRQDPGNAIWQRELSVSHNKIGSILAGQDRSAEAMAEHQKSLEIAAKLAKLDPSNQQWQADLKTYREWIELLRGKGENPAPST